MGKIVVNNSPLQGTWAAALFFHIVFLANFTHKTVAGGFVNLCSFHLCSVIKAKDPVLSTARSGVFYASALFVSHVSLSIGFVSIGFVAQLT